ncbi:uncharacterized protein LOC142597843 [Dermatophagoides farinae]
MYRKKHKSNAQTSKTITNNKFSLQVINSDSSISNNNNNHNQNQNPGPSSSSSSSTMKPDLDFSHNDFIRNSTMTTAATTTTSGKRKSIFHDFDLSDISFDSSFKSFSKTSTVIGELVTNEEKEKGKEEEEKSLINLDDIDFDDNNFDDDEIDNDIVSFLSLHDDINKSHHTDVDNNPNNNNSNNCHFVTDADKDEMMKLVKNNLIKSPCNKQPNIENDDYSQLLDDDDDDVYDFDYDLDDIDMDDIDEMIEKIKNNDNQKQIDQKEEEEKDSFDFKKANGKQCEKPSEICYKRARSLFFDIEILLMKEIAFYKKYGHEPNHQI